MQQEPTRDISHISTVCVGAEWHRFPSAFFLPSPAYRLAFIPSSFSGLLPVNFDVHQVRQFRNTSSCVMQSLEKISSHLQASMCTSLLPCRSLVHHCNLVQAIPGAYFIGACAHMQGGTAASPASLNDRNQLDPANVLPDTRSCDFLVTWLPAGIPDTGWGEHCQLSSEMDACSPP